MPQCAKQSKAYFAGWAQGGIRKGCGASFLLAAWERDRVFVSTEITPVERPKDVGHPSPLANPASVPNGFRRAFVPSGTTRKSIWLTSLFASHASTKGRSLFRSLFSARAAPFW
jgi:hypothetical protein